MRSPVFAVAATTGDVRVDALATGSLDVNTVAAAVAFSGSGLLSLSGSGSGALATVTQLVGHGHQRVTIARLLQVFGMDVSPATTLSQDPNTHDL